MKYPTSPATYVQPVHFEDFDGTQFERLVFAYHARTDRWLSLEWIGQQGKDKGRDIVGIRESDQYKDGHCICVLCANWQQLTHAKIKSDIDKAVSSLPRKPDKFRVVCGHDIPAGVRDKAKIYAQSRGVHDCELWSGKEFEEFIRKNAESLLQRFVHGDAFPDTAADLLMFAWGSVPTTDDERLSLLSLAFDRPAFSTPIHQESSLSAFRKAINDTIQVFKTGVWQTRDDGIIRRLPKASDISSPTVRTVLRDTETALIRLRECFDNLLRTGFIKHCQCNDPDCPVYMMDSNSVRELSAARANVIASFRKAYPAFPSMVT